MRNAVFFLSLFLLSVVFLPTPALAQRDYFTPEEIELIRDAQEIDRRIDVLTHAIDRRFAVLQLDVKGAKISDKEKEVWGEAPKGTRFELLVDVKRIIQKAIDDIDNLSERPDSAYIPDKEDKKAEGYAVIFPRAVRHLGDAAKRYQPALKAELDTTKDGVEKGPILDSLEMCDQIIAAVGKLKAEPPPASKKH
ncbi:MAG: hypothetical protein ABJB40_03320 [Acidobacteriota bacterium]